MPSLAMWQWAMIGFALALAAWQWRSVWLPSGQPSPAQEDDLTMLNAAAAFEAVDAYVGPLAAGARDRQIGSSMQAVWLAIYERHRSETTGATLLEQLEADAAVEAQ